MANKLITADEAAKGILESINEATSKLCAETGLPREDIKAMMDAAMEVYGAKMFYGSMPR